MEKVFSVYIMASESRVLYIGVTSNLEQRVQQHKFGSFEGFSKKYRCTLLVYFETGGDAFSAFEREKQLKKWRREKKEALIKKLNPSWKDLAENW